MRPMMFPLQPCPYQPCQLQLPLQGAWLLLNLWLVTESEEWRVFFPLHLP